MPETLNWDLWLGPAKQRPYHPAYVPLKWRGWLDYGTGSLGDMGCHILDPACWGLDLMNGHLQFVSGCGSCHVTLEVGGVKTNLSDFPARSKSCVGCQFVYHDNR